MKYCENCGKELNSLDVPCPNCGHAITKISINTIKETDTKYALLGFFIPIVGFILYFVMRSTDPIKARSAGKWALVSTVFLIIIPMIGLVLLSFILAIINSQTIALLL